MLAVFMTPVGISARCTMDEESEVMQPINEVVERIDSKESVRSDEHDLSFEVAVDAANEIGRISLDFVDGDAETYADYPYAYYTFSAKERLMLIFTENFRRQFIQNHPDRNRLVLAVPNECDIQKFVSTTIRPTSCLFDELIDCWDGPARFVADFIKYEPLGDQLQLVS